jgi:pimeloyl-ACP methyl ester carboxylesterase
MRGWVGARCGWVLFAVASLTTSAWPAGKFVPPVVVIRGKAQRLFYIPARTHDSQFRADVVFIPGDGGWRGAAVDMGNMMASLGCDVYGLDVRRYLMAFTTPDVALTENQLASDMEQLVLQLASSKHQPVMLVGWSQGAAMVVLTAARAQHKEAIGGVVTIALPESGVLGWRKRDSLLAIFGREAHEATFQTPPLLADVSPVPLWMINGTRDRFTPPAVARRLAFLARHPRRHYEIEGGSHNFGGHAKELLETLQAALDWIESSERRLKNHLRKTPVGRQEQQFSGLVQPDGPTERQGSAQVLVNENAR